MSTRNIVFIAASLDGYIADKNGGLDWLDSIPNSNKIDMGYESLIKRIDALVMGRTTFETVCNFNIAWPCSKPVFVLSRTLKEIPEKYKDKAELIKGSLAAILKEINQRGYISFILMVVKQFRVFLRKT